MLVYLPDESLLRDVARRLRDAINTECDVALSLPKSVEVTARMFGFDGFEHFQARNVPVGFDFWDEDQGEGIAARRKQQYERSLAEEKIKGLKPDMAQWVIEIVGPTRKPVSDDTTRVVIASIYDESWIAFDRQEIEDLGGGFTSKEASSDLIYARRLANSSDLGDPAYSGGEAIRSIQDTKAPVIVYAVSRSTGFAIIGHISYRTEIDEGLLLHRVEILDRHLDAARATSFGLGMSDGTDYLPAMGRAIVAKDVIHRFRGLWKSRASRNGIFKVRVAPRIRQWTDPVWPLELIATIGFCIEGEQEQHFGRRSVDFDGEVRANDLPPVGRKFVETGSPVLEALGKFSVVEMRLGSELVIDIDPQKESVKPMLWREGILREICEDDWRPKRDKDQWNDGGTLEQFARDSLESIHSTISKETGDFLALADGRRRILLNHRTHQHGRCVIDYETIIHSKWNVNAPSVDWIARDPAEPVPPRIEDIRLLLSVVRPMIRAFYREDG
jgi:hypothetical protein